jgi:hypothetical protein
MVIENRFYKIWKIGGMMLPLFVVLTILVWVSFTKSVNAFWFNDMWRYRQRVVIAAVTTQVENYQVQITGINTQALFNAGKIQANCQDIRFTDREGALLEYWIEDDGTTCQNDTSTDIWVKTTRLVTGGATTLYMYYGNPNAVPYQNGYTTFEFFDDFSGATLDASKWQISGAPSMTAGRLLLNNSQSVASYYQSSVNSKVVFRANQSVTTLDQGIVGLSNSNLSSLFSADDSLAYNFDATSGSNFEILLSNDATSIVNNTSLAENTTDNEFELSWTAASVAYVINNTAYGSTSSGTYIADEAMNVRIQNSSSTNTLSIDWVAITKHAPSMPATITFDPEERGKVPILYYDFNEVVGTTVLDKSGGNNGTLVNGMGLADNCISENCLLADGANDHVLVPNESRFDFERTDPFAVCTWFNPRQVTSTSHTLVSKLSAANTGWELTLYDGAANSDGILVYLISTWPSNRVTVIYDNVITPNQWHHICFSYSGNSNASGVSVYLNTKLLTPTSSVSTLSGSIVNNESVRIGSRHSSTLPADGYIDEVKIFQNVLTYQDVLQQYNSYNLVIGKERNQSREGQLAWWKMNESIWNGTAGEVKDSMWGNYNGTRSGNATIDIGKYGNGGIFDGNTDYVQVGSPVSNTFPLTVCAWAKPESIVSGVPQYVIANGGETTNGRGFYIYLSASNQWSFGVRGNNFIILDTVTSPAVTTDWTHICGSWDGTSSENSVKMYINGSLVAQGTPIAGTTTTTSNLRIGSPTTGTLYGFNGRIDDARVYTKVIEANEIQRLYTELPSPIAYLKLDEQSGNTGYSSAVSSVNISLTNMEDTDWQQGVRGNALDFDGTNEFASAGNLIANPFRQFTISWWMNIDSFTHASYMSTFCQAQGVYPSSLNNFCFYSSNTGASFGLQGSWSDGSALDARTTIPFSTGTWKMVTVTYDGSTLYQYVNGAPINSVAYSGKSLANANTFVLGRGYAYPGNLTTTYFDGKLDDFKIYDFALNHNQVYSEYLGNVKLASENQSIGAGLIGHWKMDELSWNGTSGEIKDAVGSNNATAFSGATTIAGKIANAGNFNGSSYAQTVNNIGITGSQPRSISFWFNQASMSNRNVVGFGTNSFGNLFDVLLYNGELIGHFWGAGQDTIGSGSAYTTGVWNHGVITYNGSVVTIYLNGQTGGQKTISINTGASNLRIGAGMYDAGYNTFNGQVDDVRVYNKALSIEEIQDLYNLKPVNSVLAVSTEKKTSVIPLLHFKLDEKSGTVASNNGSLTTSATLNNFGTSQWRIGKIGSGLLFDGTDDYVSLADSASFNWSNQLTVTTWFKSESIVTAKSLVAKTGDGTAYEFHLSLEPDGRVRCWVSSNGTNVSTMTYSQTINYTDNKWHFASCVYNGSTIQVQVDGRAGTAAAFTGTIFNGTQPVTLGGNTSWTGSWMYGGMLDNVKIWNTALSQRDLMIEYNGGKPFVWWNLDEGQGSIINDYGGNSYSGILTNMDPATDWLSGSNCRMNNCLNFDGSDDRVVIQNSTDNAIFNTNSLSLSIWIKTTTSQDGLFFNKHNGGSENGWFLAVTGNVIRYQAGGVPGFSTKVVTDGNWHHIVAVMSSTTMRLYIDGVYEGQTDRSFINNSSSVVIGQLSSGLSGYAFNGSLDEAKIFNYELNEEDIKRDYNNGAALRFE